MQVVTTVGLDIAKSVFQVHGVDAAGQVVIRRTDKKNLAIEALKKLINGDKCRPVSCFRRGQDICKPIHITHLDQVLIAKRRIDHLSFCYVETESLCIWMR